MLPTTMTKTIRELRLAERKEVIAVVPPAEELPFGRGKSGAAKLHAFA